MEVKDPNTYYFITDETIGSQGIQGIQGVQGLDGAYAAQGIQGNDGAQGPNGPRGAQGADGTIGTWYGTQAEYNALTDIDPNRLYIITDAPALQGVQGIQGVQGHSPANTETWTFLLTNGTTLTRTIYMVPEN